ncbi:MAG TPA: FAD/NAD(P)-binding protein [Thermoanaerobaculia bacterium]
MIFDVAIVGAGASGTLTAVQYARTGAGRGALIEAGARAARGLAYGTPYGAHLLNVPAARMSALPDDPSHFERWLHERGVDATFAPRALYGDYLAELLEETDITRIGGTAVGMMRSGDHWLISLHDDRTIAARNVVLALGNLPPYDPLPLASPPAEYVRDPWARGAAIGLDAEAPVLLIGTGLTALDVAIALRHHGHRGRITAVSRHGRVPQRHAPYTARPLSVVPDDFATPRGALRWVRREIVHHDWRAVIDSLRPHTAAIWQRWTLAQRASFLRHARNLWDVHRHRAAPEVPIELEAVRGRILSLSPGIEVHTDRGTYHAARVFNCTGPACDYARVDLPLVVQLRRDGFLTPDPLRLGVETADDGRLLSASGEPVPGLYTLGPLRRPALWESTAIPEIRAQAAALAQSLG